MPAEPKFAPKSTEPFIETEAAKANSIRDKLRAEQLDEFDSHEGVRRYQGHVRAHPSPGKVFINANGLDWIIHLKNDAAAYSEYLRLLGHNCLPDGTKADIEITNGQVTDVKFDFRPPIAEETSQVYLFGGKHGFVRRVCGCPVHISQSDVITFGTIKLGTWISHKTVVRENQVAASEIQIYMEQ